MTIDITLIPPERLALLQPSTDNPANVLHSRGMGNVMSDIPNEDVLPDNYPIYGDYWYVVDGKPKRSDWHGIKCAELRKRLGAKEIRRCNIVHRESGGWDSGL